VTADRNNASLSGTAFSVGWKFPDHVKGPVTRTILALFAGAQNDHAPMHLDGDIARQAGMPDVFAHGMLCMAWLGQSLRRWTQPHEILQWGTRFTAVTPLHAYVCCFGEVVEIFEDEVGRCARLSIGARIGDGTQVLAGNALVRLV
jgi:acyl dehydratase